VLEAGEEGQKPCEKGSFAVEKGKGLAAGGAFGRIPPPFLFFINFAMTATNYARFCAPFFLYLS
jgi:hypothetical protein